MIFLHFIVRQFIAKDLLRCSSSSVFRFLFFFLILLAFKRAAEQIYEVFKISATLH